MPPLISAALLPQRRRRRISLCHPGAAPPMRSGSTTIPAAAAARGTLLIDNVNATGTVALSNSGTVKGIGIAAFSGTLTAPASASNLGLATGVSVNDALTISGYTGGSGSTTHVTGSGEVVLPSASSYTGAWAVDVGRLRVDHDSGLGTGTSPIVVSSGGTLHLHGATITRNIT